MLGFIDLASLEPNAAAKALLGCKLVRTVGGQTLAGRIVETESYHQDDPASHTFRGKTGRNSVMFGPAGRAYVYFTYGMHYCMNVTVGAEGYGAAVLIRALEPIAGIEAMQKNRPAVTVSNLTNGPAKLTQALAIDKQLNGHNLANPPLQLLTGTPVKPSQITSARRIGISAGANELARFYIKGNPYVSKP